MSTILATPSWPKVHKLELFPKYIQTGTQNWGSGCLPINHVRCTVWESFAPGLLLCKGDCPALEKNVTFMPRRASMAESSESCFSMASAWYMDYSCFCSSAEPAVSSFSDLNKFNLAIFQLHPKKSQHISLIYNERNHWQNLLVYYYQQIACDMSQNGLWYR